MNKNVEHKADPHIAMARYHIKNALKEHERKATPQSPSMYAIDDPFERETVLALESLANAVEALATPR